MIIFGFIQTKCYHCSNDNKNYQYLTDGLITIMKIIKSVEIINFRSIVKLETPFDFNHLNIIVGKNDIGKSNFLKALNLFFNGQTEIGVPFRFQDDFCKHAKVPNKKAPEVVIRVEFAIPYRFKDHEPLVWTKVWRREGLY